SNAIKKIQGRMNRACEKAHRDPQSVRLLLATKTVPVEKIKEAISLGYPLIGENKVQEIEEKYEGLRSIKHEKHFIGHLQTNKIKILMRYIEEMIQLVGTTYFMKTLHN